MRAGSRQQPRSRATFINSLGLILALTLGFRYAGQTRTLRRTLAVNVLASYGLGAASFPSSNAEEWVDGDRHQEHTLADLPSAADCSVTPPPMAFLHIPKTGGTSITSYITSNLDVKCNQLHISPFLTFVKVIKEDTFKSLRQRPPGAAADWQPPKCNYAHLRVGPEGDARAVYTAMVLSEGFKVQHVLGHLPFGWCQLVDQGCSYVTILREPMQRLASHWGYLHHRHPDLIRQACGERCNSLGGFAQQLLDGTVQHVLGGLDNMQAPDCSLPPTMAPLQTRMLSGSEFLASIFAHKSCKHNLTECADSAPIRADQAMLKLAKHNLQNHFKVIGFLDDLSGFMEDMEHAFCFQLKNVPLMNRLGTGNNFVNNTDPATVRLVERTQLLDIELYAFARELVSARRAVINGSNRREAG